LIWTDTGGITPLSGISATLNTFAYNVSSDGSTVVGTAAGSVFEASPRFAYRWPAQTGTVSLGSLLGIAEGLEISGDGSVAGGFTYDPKVGIEFNAFVWSQATSSVLLEDYLASQGHDLSYWSRLERVTGFSHDGSIVVGTGFNVNGQLEGFAANLVAVPEPGSAAILIGFAGFALLRRRR